MKKTAFRIAGIMLLVVGVLLQFVPGVQFLGLCLAGLAVLVTFYPYFPKTVLVILSLLLTALLLMEIPIIRASKRQAPKDLDYVIVLGAAVYGEAPSHALMERLWAARDYLNENPETKAVLSGGQGPGESIPEALAMQRALMAMGIAEDRLLLEDQATDTNENIRFSFAILLADWEKNGLPEAPSVGIVSSEYHMFRATYLAQKAGYTVSGVPAETGIVISRINYFIREAPAMLKAVLIDR